MLIFKMTDARSQFIHFSLSVEYGTQDFVDLLLELHTKVIMA